MMYNIAITGISGFVGENLANFLKKEKYQISGVSRKSGTSKQMDYNDVDATFLSTQNALIHLAGKAHDLKKTTEEKDYFEANTELTKKVFKQFLESNCEVFVYMSSVKAVADTVKDILTEETQTHSQNSIWKIQTRCGAIPLVSRTFKRKKSVYSKTLYDSWAW